MERSESRSFEHDRRPRSPHRFGSSRNFSRSDGGGRFPAYRGRDNEQCRRYSDNGHLKRKFIPLHDRRQSPPSESSTEKVVLNQLAGETLRKVRHDRFKQDRTLERKSFQRNKEVNVDPSSAPRGGDYFLHDNRTHYIPRRRKPISPQNDEDGTPQGWRNDSFGGRSQDDRHSDTSFEHGYKQDRRDRRFKPFENPYFSSSRPEKPFDRTKSQWKHDMFEEISKDEN